MPRLPDLRFAPDCTIELDGSPVPARRGESVAVALLAAGHAVLGRSAKYHRPRGAFCLSGSCHACCARIDGVPNQRSCRVPCRPGLVVSTQNGFPSARCDLLGVLDRVYARGLDHHHLMTSSALLNRLAIATSRRFTGQGRLPDRLLSPAASAREERWDALVVGGGPAGLGAAEALAGTGVPVLLAESDSLLGGRLRCGLGRAADPALSWAAEVARKVTEQGGQVLLNATALGIWQDGGSRVVVLRVEEGTPPLRLVYATRVVLATGTHPTPPPLPRNDLPGLLAARGLARALSENGLVPGSFAVVLGENEEASALAERLWKAGMQVRPTSTASDLRGGRRIRSVRLSHGERVACDTLVVAGTRAPASDLARQAGAALVFDEEAKLWRVKASPFGETGRAGLWVAGEMMFPLSADEAAETGRRAGKAAHGHS